MWEGEGGVGGAEVVELLGDGGDEVVVVEIEKRGGVRCEGGRGWMCGWVGGRAGGGEGAEEVGHGGVEVAVERLRWRGDWYAVVVVGRRRCESMGWRLVGH